MNFAASDLLECHAVASAPVSTSVSSTWHEIAAPTST
jgi:hypothetical protein